MRQFIIAGGDPLLSFRGSHRGRAMKRYVYFWAALAVLGATAAHADDTRPLLRDPYGAKNAILSAFMLMGYEQHCAGLPPSAKNILNKLLDTMLVDDRILVKQVADRTNQVPNFCAHAEELVSWP
jgi:hypothetical protein